MALKRLVTTNKEIDRLQDAVDYEFRRYEATGFLPAGASVDIDSSSAGEIDVQHGLGRKPQGWIVTYVETSSAATSAPSVFYRAGARKDTKRLTLYVTAAFEALRLWVY